MSLQMTDRDLGWRQLEEMLGDTDKLELRVGILSGRPRYPDRGRSPVARVAGVHGVHKMIARIIDEHESEIDERIADASRRIMDGREPREALQEVAYWLRDLVRERVRDAGLMERGYLLDTIRGVVLAGRKRVAGDRPAAAPQPSR